MSEGCRACGNAEGTVTESMGPLIVVTCDKCGTEEQIHISPPPTLQGLTHFNPPEPGEQFPL